MSLPSSRRENRAAVRALYDQCDSYDGLLVLAGRTRDLLAAQLSNRIRNWRANHNLDSLDEAFTQHKAYTFTDSHKHRPKRARIQPPDVPAASLSSSSPSAPQPLAVAPSSPDVVAPGVPASLSAALLSSLSDTVSPVSLPSSSASLQPSSVASSSADVAPVQADVSPASVETSSSSSSGDTLSRLQAQLDALKKEVWALRGLQQQTNTPSSLQYKLVPPKFRKHCRVLSIVGDGRCLLYSLLQVGRAMLPTSWEADDLRQQLRTHLMSTYTDEVWSGRVPPQLGENLSVSTFAERFLSKPTVHLPPDAVCLWQDVVAPTTNVYVLMRSQHGAYDRDRVERLPSPSPPTSAVVLLFTWENGVGHYELVTYRNVITLPCAHPFVQHLNVLHDEFVAGMAVEPRRQLRHESGTKRSAEERDDDIVVESADSGIS